ncbi:hypothetical protein JHW43_001550 [Diplocarpon mali]|nr:hypothetical protein JHW43_001550 [Diplocarpon mali]
MPLQYDSTLRVLYEELENVSRRDRAPCITQGQFMEENRKHQAEWSVAKPDADEAWISYWAEASLWNNLVSSRYEILKPFPGRPPTEVQDTSTPATEPQPTNKPTPNNNLNPFFCRAAPAPDVTTYPTQGTMLTQRREELERELGSVGNRMYQGPALSSANAAAKFLVHPSHHRDTAAGNKSGDGGQPATRPLGASPSNIWSRPIDEPICRSSKDGATIFKKKDLKPNSQKSRKCLSIQRSDVPDVSQLGISSATLSPYASSRNTDSGEEISKSSSKEEASKLRCSLKAIFSKPVNSNVEAKYEPSFWDEELGIPRAAAICCAPNATTAIWGNEGDAIETVNIMIGKVVRILVALHPLGPKDRFSPLIWQDVHFGYNPYDPDVKVVADWVQEFIDEFSSLEEECGSLPDEFCLWAKKNFPPPEVKKWLPKPFVTSIPRIPRGRMAVAVDDTKTLPFRVMGFSTELLYFMDALDLVERLYCEVV